MTLLQYYLFANIYILAFWMVYRIWLSKTNYFKSIRIYLNSALLLSSLLPLIQYGVTNLIGPVPIVTASENLPFVGIIYDYQIGEVLSTHHGYTFNWSGIFVVMLLSGSVITALIYGFNHFKIMSLIRKSSEYLRLENGLKVSKSDEVSIPFLYNRRILLPSGITQEELALALKHEVLHYQNRHHFDNLIYSFLHMVFWVNPFFLLLKRALKLNNEYQVDRQILATGMDQVSYKLSLIKYAVGRQLFSLANGLSNNDIKNRLAMINNSCIRKGKWRFYLLIPMTGMLFTIFCYACFQPEQQEVATNSPVIDNQKDALAVKFIFLSNEDLSEVNKENFIVVLMNRNSMLMIAGEKYPQNVEQKIISEYNKRLDGYNVESSEGIQEVEPLDIRIIIQKDLSANMDDYQKLLDTIIAALFKVREMQSIRLFGADFNSLTVSEREVIDQLVPLRIYGELPDKDMNRVSKSEPTG